MSLVHETDYGTPASKSSEMVTLTIDGQAVTVPAGTSIMRAAMDIGTQVPKLCATDSVDAFGSCRLCLVEIQGRPGTPASCTTPVGSGMVVSTQTERLKQIRKGVMELYISDHPLDCLTCAANGDCELQDMAGAVGLRDVRYGYDGENHTKQAKDESNPYFTFDPSKCIVCSRCVRACEEVQGTFALTIQGRGFDSKVSAGMAEPFVEFGVRVVRRLRAGLPDGDAVGEERHRHRRARAFGGDDLRLLRRRLQLQGRDARRGTRAHGPLQGRQGQSRPFVREGPLRLGLRQPSRAHPEADDPRDHRPAVARSDLGSGDRARRLGVQAPAGQARPAGDRRHHLVTLHQRGDLPGAEAGARRLRQQQRRYLRPRLPFADRLWPQDRLRHLGRHAGLRLGRAYRRRPDHRRQPDRRPSGVRLAHEEAAAPGRQADRHRSAPHRHGAHAAHRGAVPSAAAPGHQCRDAERDRPCHRHRRPGEREVRPRILRPRAPSSTGRPSCRSRRTAPRRSA